MIQIILRPVGYGVITFSSKTILTLCHFFEIFFFSQNKFANKATGNSVTLVVTKHSSSKSNASIRRSWGLIPLSRLWQNNRGVRAFSFLKIFFLSKISAFSFIFSLFLAFYPDFTVFFLIFLHVASHTSEYALCSVEQLPLHSQDLIK